MGDNLLRIMGDGVSEESYKMRSNQQLKESEEIACAKALRKARAWRV